MIQFSCGDKVVIKYRNKKLSRGIVTRYIKSTNINDKVSIILETGQKIDHQIKYVRMRS